MISVLVTNSDFQTVGKRMALDVVRSELTADHCDIAHLMEGSLRVMLLTVARASEKGANIPERSSIEIFK